MPSVIFCGGSSSYLINGVQLHNYNYNNSIKLSIITLILFANPITGNTIDIIHQILQLSPSNFRLVSFFSHSASIKHPLRSLLTIFMFYMYSIPCLILCSNSIQFKFYLSSIFYLGLHFYSAYLLAFCLFLLSALGLTSTTLFPSSFSILSLPSTLNSYSILKLDILLLDCPLFK